MGEGEVRRSMVVTDQWRALRRRPPADTGRAVLYLVMAAISVAFAVKIAHHGFIDLNVYRAGGRAYLDGVGLYGSDFQSPLGLRFIYAPLAAVLFVPYTLMSDAWAHGVWTVITVLLVLWVLHAVCDRLGVTTPAMAPLVLLAPALLLEPVRETISFGQIDVGMVALVVLDCVGVIPKRFRGVGIGIAAAIKVTPAAFGLLLLVRRDYASAARAAAAFLVCGALGWAFNPTDSKEYWTSVFFDSSRAGGAMYGPNQAITGLLARLGLTGTTREVAWLAISLVVVVAATWAARRYTLAGEHVVAMSVIALAALLVAPFSVTHHWSYVVLLLPLLAAKQYASWRYLLAVVAVVFSAGVIWYLPIGDDLEHERWTWLDQLTGNSQCLAAVALLVAAVLAARRRRALPGAPGPAYPEVGRTEQVPESSSQAGADVTGVAEGERAGTLSG